MSGTKALALENWCREREIAFTRFDYSGHGESSGTFESGAIGDWLEDAEAVFDEVTEGNQILVGSSMGGWISLLLAMRQRERTAAVVTIACATDFTERLLRPALTEPQLKSLELNGFAELPSAYSDNDKRLLSEGTEHLLLASSIPILCPVRMLHGLDDEDVPWEISRETVERLESEDTELILIEKGDHRLSKPEELHRITNVIERLLDHTPSGIT